MKRGHRGKVGAPEGRKEARKRLFFFFLRLGLKEELRLRGEAGGECGSELVGLVLERWSFIMQHSRAISPFTLSEEAELFFFLF
jgi:hypothetical protein